MEKQLNTFKADIWLMKAVDAVGGKNYDSQIAYAEQRLSQFEKAVNDMIGTKVGDTYKSGSEVKDRNWGRELKDYKYTEINSLADFTDDITAAVVEGIGGLGSSLLEDRYRGMRYQNVKEKVDENVQELLDDYRNAMENVANITDFRGVSAAEQEKILNSDTYRSHLEKLQRYENEFGALQDAGVPLNVPTLTRDAHGNYTSTESAAVRNRTVGRLGEPVKSIQQADGTWSVTGSWSGTVFQSGLADATAAETWANKNQSGGTADPTGAFDTSLTPTDANGGTTTTEPNGSTTGGLGDPSATTTDPAGGTTAAAAGVDPSDKEWVDGLYQKYFDRNATSAELANWSVETPDSLETFMKSEATKYGYTSKYFQDSINSRNEAALAIIDNSTLPPELKTLWKTFVGAYEGAEVDQQEILDTFAKIKADTIDPYFKGLTDIALADLKANFGYLDRSRETETEAERAAAGQSIRQAKDGLEAAGRTFTGLGVEQLGAESAFAQQASDEVATPAQETFGGMFYEGDVNQQNRMLASSSKSRYEKAISDLGVAAESSLGSDTVSGLGLGLPTVGGVQGDMATAQQEKEGDTLNSILTNYYEKQNLNTNQTLT